MVSSVHISLGEKIRHIRVAKGLSQENLARAIKCSVATISRIESRKTECTDDVLTDIKKFLSIENAPLLAHEREIYKSQLLIYDGWLSVGRVADVKVALHKMSCVMDLPFEHKLKLLFMLSEAKLLIKEFNLSAAEKKLDEAEMLLNKVNDEVLYEYLNVRGLHFHYRFDMLSALKYYFQALDLSKGNLDVKLQVNIGVCYYYLGKPFEAIILLENVKTKYYIDSGHPMRCHVVYIIASCYMLIFEFRKAQRLFDEIIIEIKLMDNEFIIGETLLNIGLLQMKLKNYEESINCFNEVLIRLPIEWIGYKVAVYQKGLILLKMSQFGECREVIAYGQSISEGDELATVHFNALKCLLTLDNVASVDYIQNTAIPYLRSYGVFKFQALELCRMLEQYFYKKRAKTKALAVAATMRAIYEELFLGENALEHFNY